MFLSSSTDFENDKMLKYFSMFLHIHNIGIILFSYIYKFIYESFWLSSKFTDALTSQHGWKSSGNTMENQNQQEEYLRPAGNLLFLTTNKVKCL